MRTGALPSWTYAPNFRRSVIARQVLAPQDIEARFGLTGGNIFQGAMTSTALLPAPAARLCGLSHAGVGLYLCGAATHPGGGVMGACGYNAAREIPARPNSVAGRQPGLRAAGMPVRQ